MVILLVCGRGRTPTQSNLTTKLVSGSLASPGGRQSKGTNFSGLAFLFEIDAQTWRAPCCDGCCVACFLLVIFGKNSSAAFFFLNVWATSYLTSSIKWTSMKMLGNAMDSIKQHRPSIWHSVWSDGDFQRQAAMLAKSPECFRPRWFLDSILFGLGGRTPSFKSQLCRFLLRDLTS